MLSTKSQAGTPEWTAPGAAQGERRRGRCMPCTMQRVRCMLPLLSPTSLPTSSHPVCTSCSCPAEVLRSQPYNEKCDVYR
jgi:hypothetical protein